MGNFTLFVFSLSGFFSFFFTFLCFISSILEDEEKLSEYRRFNNISLIVFLTFGCLYFLGLFFNVI